MQTSPNTSPKRRKLAKAFVSILLFTTLGHAEETGLTVESVEARKEPTLILFESDDCVVCQKMQPNLDTLLKDQRFSKVSIQKVDFKSIAPNVKEMKRKWHVSKQSTLLLIENGKIQGRLVDQWTEAPIERILKKTIH